MWFREGDKVRHRGLRFISGIVIKVMKLPDADLEDDRSCFYKVQLKNGHLYSDRAAEWELTFDDLGDRPLRPKDEPEEQFFVDTAPESGM